MNPILINYLNELDEILKQSDLKQEEQEYRLNFVKEGFENINDEFTKYDKYIKDSLISLYYKGIKIHITKETFKEDYINFQIEHLKSDLYDSYKETLPETQIEREKIRKEREESFKKNEEYELNFMKEYYPEYLEGGYFQSNEFNEIFDKVSEYAKEQVAIHFADGHISYPMNPRRYYDIIISKLKSDYGIDWKDRDTIWYEMHPNGYIFH